MIILNTVGLGVGGCMNGRDTKRDESIDTIGDKLYAAITLGAGISREV